MWRPSLTFGFSGRGYKGLFLDQVARMWGLHLESRFSLAWDASSDVEASCLYICAIADTAPKTLNLTQVVGSDANAYSHNFSWKSLKWPINCEKHLGTQADRESRFKVQSHVHSGAYALWGEQQPKCQSAGPRQPCGGLRALCSWTAWVQTLAPPLPSCVSTDKFCELSVCFLLCEKRNHTYLIGY